MSGESDPRPEAAPDAAGSPTRRHGSDASTDASTEPTLDRGDLRPAIRVPPPGPRSRDLAIHLAAAEAPGVNTLYRGEVPILWQEACGANVLDPDGNRYLDLTSGFGVAAVGHRHPRVVAAVRKQAGRLLHALGDVHGHPLRVELAQRLAARVPVATAAPPPDGTPDAAPSAAPAATLAAATQAAPVSVYPAISGAEAVEIAIKTALLATGRPGVLGFHPGYHGMTLGALALTSRPAFRQPFAGHLHPHARHLPYGAGEQVLEAALAREDVACVVVEPIVGREGVLVPPAGWLGALAEACRRHGTLLVADEVFTGFGRTGRWFAVEHAGVRPDLLVCGKALGGGLPIAAVAGRRPLLDAWATEGEALHTATFLANPLACAAALAVLDILESEDLPARAARLGQQLHARLADWPARHPAIEAVRGRGLLAGLQLDTAGTAATLVGNALQRGLLLLAGGPEGRVAQIVPPLTITEEQLTTALDLLEAAIP